MKLHTEKCKNCVHWRAASSPQKLKMCHYILDIGNSRGCSVENCDKMSKEKISTRKNIRYGKGA